MTPFDAWDAARLGPEMLGRRWGLNTEAAKTVKRAVYGSCRRISDAWAPAIGSWGAVETASEIGGRVGKTRREVVDYAKSLGLTTATSTLRRSPAELAVALWCDRGSRSARASCQRFGVTHFERVLYCAAVEDLFVADSISIHDLLIDTLDALEARWRRLRVSLRPTTSSPAVVLEHLGRGDLNWLPSPLRTPRHATPMDEAVEAVGIHRMR